MKHRSIFENRSPALTMKDAYRILEVLGPMPAEALAAMVDYGLSDHEIGRYYDLPHDMITILRDYWGIAGNP
ncbi:hypothetical protein [Aquicoccus sp.]|uniref:hypothetical protein n=1 Tax=Aquicoccus sp. TaxID=2055851 RepID=UPI0035647568